MTDRELLEKAAKAAGVNWRDWTPTLYAGETELRDWPHDWNPLTDDGDALRLAVKLRLEILPLEGGGVDVQRTTEQEPFGELLASEISTDPYAATRRAIVRAAAAIEGDQ
jgi:hypothetical protein